VRCVNDWARTTGMTTAIVISITGITKITVPAGPARRD
jgi:hypothetical protein